jgi:AraC-like DNA-binding protein
LAGHESIDVRFFAPPEDLGPCFTTFYRLRVDIPEGEVLEDWLQPEWANLRFFASNPPTAEFDGGPRVSGARFQATGPTSHPTHFRMGRTRMWGIGLFPLGWARYVGMNASASANTIVDGEQDRVFRHFAPLCEALCDPDGDDDTQFAVLSDFFRANVRPVRDDARIQAVHSVMVDPLLLQVDEFARRCGLSKRTLERLCARHFGFSPRLLLRRQRLMRTLGAFMLTPQASWSQVIDRHYHDQSHFVHEFHAFMGCTPSDYASTPHPVLGAFMAERARVWGSPAQTLDAPK